MRIAIDVMGGDHAPDAIVRGCLDALADIGADDELILVGDAETVREIMDERDVDDPRVSIEHTSEVIEMHESPVEAVRCKQDSSIVRLARLGSSKKSENPADVIISAGNTGAMVSAATMHMRRLEGVHRPGIACAMPAFHGPVVLCDIGANPEPRETHLAQYAEMADIYARRVLGMHSPKVALLNIGSEEEKGTGMIRTVRNMLRATPELNYQGYIEGRDLFKGVADVVVCDGFVGNTVLKVAEGLSRSLFQAIAHEVLTEDPELALRLEPVVAGLKKRNDYHEYGGAPLLGVNGVCFICHGSSESRTIRNTIRNAREYVKAGVNEAIVERLRKLEAGAPTTGEAA